MDYTCKYGLVISVFDCLTFVRDDEKKMDWWLRTRFVKNVT